MLGRFALPSQRQQVHARTLRGGVAAVGSQGIIFVVRVLSTAVLARLLVPEDFGLVAMVLTVSAFAQVVRDVGLSSATMQASSLTHDQVSNLFWLNTLVGLLAALFMIAAAPLTASFFNDSRLLGIGVWMSLSFVFGGLSTQHAALLKRRMRFVIVARYEVLATVAGALCAVLFAVMWRERPWAYMALVSMILVKSFTYMIFMWLGCRWVPSLPRRQVDTRPLLRLGAGITGFNVVNYLARNGDNILIGRLVGSVPLAFYSKAYQFLLFPVQQIRTPLIGVATPALSSLREDRDAYRQYLERLLMFLGFVIMPLMAYAFVHADIVVRLFFGDQWVAAIPFFRIFAFVGLVQPFIGLGGLVLITTGQGRRYFLYGCIQSAVFVTAFLIGILWGAVGVAVSYAVANYLSAWPLWCFATKRQDLDFRFFLRSLRYPLGMSMLTGCLAGILRFWGVWDLPLIWAFGLSGIVWVGIYLLLYMIFPSGRTFYRMGYDGVTLMLQKQEDTTS